MAGGNPGGVSQPVLEGRNGAIWEKYCAGWTQEHLAAEYGIHQTRVSQIIRAVREKIGKHDREEFLDRQVDAVQALQRRIREMIDADPPPAFDQRGNVLRDPDSGAVVRDVAAKQKAIALEIQALDRMTRLLGLDASKEVNVNITASERAARTAMAEEAAGFLHGADD